MSGKLIMCKGLPGSGKSTWAKAQKAVRVNKDDIRHEMNAKDWNHDREKEVKRIRDFRICEALSQGKTVISDDTNFSPVHEARFRDLAAKDKATFEINDSFLSVTVEECIRNDAQREEFDQVGAVVIQDAYNRWCRPEKS